MPLSRWQDTILLNRGQYFEDCTSRATWISSSAGDGFFRALHIHCLGAGTSPPLRRLPTSRSVLSSRIAKSRARLRVKTYLAGLPHTAPRFF